MATTIRQAIHTAVEGLTGVTTLLANGQASVIPWGRLSPKTAMPCVVIRNAGRGGGPRSLPFYKDSWMIMAYDEGQAAQIGGSYKIDLIIDALRTGLNGASLTLVGQQEQVFMCHLDNYGSPDLFDYILERPYRYITVGVEGVYSHDYR